MATTVLAGGRNSASSSSANVPAPGPAPANGVMNGSVIPMGSAQDHARHRQQFGAQGEPALNYDIKDTQHVSPAYDQGYHAQQNGTGFRNRSPSYFRNSEGPTLSGWLSTAFSSAAGSLDQLGRQDGAGRKSLLASLSSSKSDLKANLGFVGLCALWYLSSAFSSNTGKSIMTRFRYPVTLTFIQFSFVAGYCVLFLAVREQSAVVAPIVGPAGRRGSMNTMQGWGIKKPSRSMFQGTFTMSLFQIAGHVFSSMAIARVPVSTVHTIKALSPLFTVLSYAALFGVRYGSSTYIALLPLTLGVMLACSFDLRANAVGFLCALGSTIIFVSQNIFSKKLLPKESSAGAAAPSGSSAGGNKQLDKLNLLFYSSGMAFFLMIPIWLYSDAGTLLNAWLDPPETPTSTGSTASLILAFFLNGSVHFAQNILAFSILARTSPVTYSIASLIKRIAVICIAIVWSGQKVSLIQAIGMTMTFGGLWMYNRAKSDVDKGERKRGALEKRHEMFLPTTAEDARELDGSTPPPMDRIRLANGSKGQPFTVMADSAPPPSAKPRNRSLTGHQSAFVPPPPHQSATLSNGHVAGGASTAFR